MTTCTEARRLLEEEIKAVVVASKGAANDAYYRGRLSALLFVRDRILSAQPEPAAREAVLVEAVKENAETFHATHAAEGEFETCMDVMCESNRAVLADTSPAAAALLAQGERLRSFRDELRGTPGNSVGPFQWIADRLDSILEEDTRLGMSRAALAPGEEKE